MRNRTMFEKIFAFLLPTLLWAWFLYDNSMFVEYYLDQTNRTWVSKFSANGFFPLALFALIFAFIIFGGKKDK